jgi:hypothetical protein
MYIPTISYAATAPATKSAVSSDASPSASPEETTLELKKRIEKVAKRDQVRGAISNLFSDKFGFVGEVSRLSQEALTVKQNGDSRILPLTENITIVRAGKKIKAEEIEVGNWVTVLGMGTNEKFTPEIIIVSASALKPKQKVVMLGTITKITKTNITIMARGDQGEQTFILPKAAKFENADGGTLKVTDFEEDLSVLVVGTRNDKDQLELSTLRSLTDVKATQNER